MNTQIIMNIHLGFYDFSTAAAAHINLIEIGLLGAFLSLIQKPAE
jgi:hypothetical protein